MQAAISQNQIHVSTNRLNVRIRMHRFVIGVLLLLAGSAARANVPNQFSVQGVLRDNMGKLQSMPVLAVTVSLFDAQMGGNRLAGPYGPRSVMASNGLFTFSISDDNIRSELASANQVWLEVTVGNDIFPRQQVTPDVYALMCASAQQADQLSSACTGCVTNTQIMPSTITADRMAQPAGYKYAGPFGTNNSSNQVYLGAYDTAITIGSISFTPPNPAPGVVLVNASAIGAFWFHDVSNNAQPDRLKCCLSASGSGANSCSQWDVPGSYPTMGGGSSGWGSPILLTHLFPYSGTGAFTATLACSIPPPPNPDPVSGQPRHQGQPPPINAFDPKNQSYGFVITDSHTLQALYMPAQLLP
jgi:hypothetical protein